MARKNSLITCYFWSVVQVRPTWQLVVWLHGNAFGQNCSSLSWALGCDPCTTL